MRILTVIACKGRNKYKRRSKVSSYRFRIKRYVFKRIDFTRQISFFNFCKIPDKKSREFSEKALDTKTILCYNNHRCESDENKIGECGGIGRRARLRGVW